MNIQEAINALPPSGGTVHIPVGNHTGGPIVMRSGVILQGENKNTIIPPVAPSYVRIYNCGLRDLMIDARPHPGYYALDWRNVSTSDVTNVHLEGTEYGLVMTGPSYYNLFSQLTVNCTHTAVELSNGANQNTFIGGKWSAKRGIGIYGCNGITLIGTSLENGINDMIFKIISGDDGSTSARGVRMEDSNHSSTYWNT